MALWANAEPSPANSVTCPGALARLMEWDSDPEEERGGPPDTLSLIRYSASGIHVA